MKSLYTVGAILSMVFVALGLCWLYQPGVFSIGESVCILGIFSGLALNVGLQIFHLRDRIAALEKRVQEPK